MTVFAGGGFDIELERATLTMVAPQQFPTARKLDLTCNPFLFSRVCDEGDGMRLSVVSALARLDLDPWQEAAELARMPRDSAIQRLAHLLARVPVAHNQISDPKSVATRIVELLPQSETRDRQTALGPDIPTAPLSKTFVGIMFLMTLVVIMTGFFEQSRPSPEPSSNGKPPISRSALDATRAQIALR